MVKALMTVGVLLIGYAGVNWFGTMVVWVDRLTLQEDASAIQATQTYTQLTHWALVGLVGIILMFGAFLVDKFEKLNERNSSNETQPSNETQSSGQKRWRDGW